MDIRNKTVWITGASSGIGAAVAREFGKKAGTIILSARRKEVLEDIASTISPAKTLIVEMDVADETSVNSAFAKVTEQTEGIDILVNNAGISQRAKAEDTSMEVDRKIMEVNFFGAVRLTKLVLPQMLERGGHIVAVSSIVGKFGFPLRTAYSASKHAIHGFFDSLRLEVEDRGVEVTVVCPGRIKTEISLNALSGDGEKHGEMNPGQAGGISAEKCAREIARAVRKNKREVLIGGKELNMVKLKRWLPGLFHKVSKKVAVK